MHQHVIQDQIAVRYADGIDDVWDSWEPSLRRCERLLGATAWRTSMDDEQATQLRRAQYRAHTAAEFAAGLIPPSSATEAHASLLGALASCRDVLGVLAIRAELDEFDDDVAEIGLHAVEMTRDAFHGARTTTALVHAWIADDHIAPEWLDEHSPSSHVWPWVLRMLVMAAISLAIVLVVQVVVLGTIA